MMAHNPVTRNMSRQEYQGNVVLLIIGGNDTTRNTISGSVYELNRNPDQYAKLRANPDLIGSMVSESIRYQTPLAHMARTALKDTEVGGKMIREGDRVAMWYISGNRDESVIADPDVYTSTASARATTCRSASASTAASATASPRCSSPSSGKRS